MGTILKQKTCVLEVFHFSNFHSKLKGKKLENSSLKVSANPLGLLAENRSNIKACLRELVIYVNPGELALFYGSSS